MKKEALQRTVKNLSRLSIVLLLMLWFALFAVLALFLRLEEVQKGITSALYWVADSVHTAFEDF